MWKPAVPLIRSSNCCRRDSLHRHAKINTERSTSRLQQLYTGLSGCAVSLQLRSFVWKAALLNFMALDQQHVQKHYSCVSRPQKFYIKIRSQKLDLYTSIYGNIRNSVQMPSIQHRWVFLITFWNITEIAKDNYAYHVLGDININLLNATSDSRIQQYIDTLCSLGWYPVINEPTRVVNEAELCIDHIWTNNLSTRIKPYIMLHDTGWHKKNYHHLNLNNFWNN